MVSQQLREHRRSLFEPDMCKSQCEARLQLGRDIIWISSPNITSIGKKIYKFCMLRCHDRTNPARSILVKNAKKEKELQAQIKIDLIKLEQNHPNKAKKIRSYLKKI